MGCLQESPSRPLSRRPVRPAGYFKEQRLARQKNAREQDQPMRISEAFSGLACRSNGRVRVVVRSPTASGSRRCASKFLILTRSVDSP